MGFLWSAANGGGLPKETPTVGFTAGATDAYGNTIADAQKAALGVNAQQGNLSNMLFDEARGGGPNLAANQLANATNTNNQLAAGAIAGQRGINPGAAQRLILQNQAANNMQAGQSAATLRLQQHLGAQAQLGTVLGQQEQGATNIFGTAGGLQNNQNMTNANVASENAKLVDSTNRMRAQAVADQSKSLDGLVGAAGSAIAAGVTGGASLVPQAAASLASDAVPGTKPQSMFKGPEPTMDEGKVFAAHGGRIPGRALVRGDSPKNDTVPAMLSPGEDVLPRSVTQSADPGEAAKRFVNAHRQQKARETAVAQGPGPGIARLRELKQRHADASAHHGAMAAHVADLEKIVRKAPESVQRFYKGAVGVEQVGPPQETLADVYPSTEGVSEADALPSEGVPPGISNAVSLTPNPYGSKDPEPHMSSEDMLAANPAILQNPTVDEFKDLGAGGGNEIVKFLKDKLAPPSPPVPVSSPEEEAMLAAHETRAADGGHAWVTPETAAKERATGSVSAHVRTHTPGNGGGSGGEPKDILPPSQQDAIEKQWIEARNAQATEEQRAFKQQAAIEADKAARLTAMQADYQTTLAEHKKKSDQLFADVATSNIDPERFWASKSENQRIGLVIGQALGAFGAALGHTPNFAKEMIDGAISRDLDAQKTDLGKKETLLGRYMEQGRDMAQAYNMAKADLYDFTAGKLAELSAQSNSTQAQSMAQQAIAGYRGQSQALRQQDAMTRSHEAWFGPNQREGIALKNSEIAKNMAESRELGARASALNSKGANTLQFPVRLNSGEFVSALGKEEQTKATGELEAIQAARQTLAKGKELGRTLADWTAGGAREQSLKAQLLATLEKVQTSGVRNKDLLRQIKEGETPNFGAWFTQGAKDAKIETLEEMLKQREDAIGNSLTSAPFRKSLDFRAQ